MGKMEALFKILFAAHGIHSNPRRQLGLKAALCLSDYFNTPGYAGMPVAGWNYTVHG